MQQNLNSTGIFTPVAAQEAVTLEAKRGKRGEATLSPEEVSILVLHRSDQAMVNVGQPIISPPSLWLGTVKTPQTAPLLSALLCDSL